jgi:Mycothiol maleylpyruvate isomerase N-terminal domain
MARPRDGHLWALAHAERAALADDLAGLGAEQWRHDTLCGEWDVEQVVAHLTAAASLNQRQWLRSMLGARFRPDVHNQRRLAEHRGRTPAETLDRFRAVITSTTAPSSHTPAYLGEVAAGTGPLVTGSTLALVMAMAGRVPYLAGLDGPGVPALRSRLHAKASESAR